MLSLRQRAFNFLARRDYASQELIDKLKKYASREEAEAVVASFIASGIISDERYIASYLNVKQNKFGLVKLRIMLYNKTGNCELVDRIIAGSDLDQVSAAYKIWEKKFRPALDAKEQARQIRFLQYRGFSFDIIKKVFAHAKEDFGNI